MKILFLLTQSLDSPSGLGRYWPLSCELVRLGHSVSLLALHPDWQNLTERRFERQGVHVEYVAQMHVLKSGHGKQYFSSRQLWGIAALSTWRLAQAALRRPADAVHIAKPHPMNGMAALLARWLRGRRLYLDCDDYEAASNRFGAGWQRRGVAFVEDRLPRRVRGVTTNTRFMAQRLAALGVSGERIVYVPNGVDRARFARTDAARVAALRAELDLGDGPVVLYLGSLSPTSHPIDLLIAAFVQVSAHLPAARLLLVGGGEGYESLQAQAQAAGIGQRAIFSGRVPPEAAPDYIQLASVSVDPVHDDPAARSRSPLKLFESWAAGVPFVSADVGDRRELLGDPPAGLLARPGDAASLAKVILQVLRHPELADSLRRRGQERIGAFYWERLVQDFVQVYAQ